MVKAYSGLGSASVILRGFSNFGDSGVGKVHTRAHACTHTRKQFRGVATALLITSLDLLAGGDFRARARVYFAHVANIGRRLLTV